jgi:hypothetical protein
VVITHMSPPRAIPDDAPFPDPEPGRTWEDVRSDYERDGVVCARGVFNKGGADVGTADGGGGVGVGGGGGDGGGGGGGEGVRGAGGAEGEVGDAGEEGRGGEGGAGGGGGHGEGWIEYLREECDARLKSSSSAGMMEEYTPAGNQGRFCGEMDVSRHDMPRDAIPSTPGGGGGDTANTENRFRRFVFESPAARLAAAVTGAETVNFFYDFLLVKEPGTGEVTRWGCTHTSNAVDP